MILLSNFWGAVHTAGLFFLFPSQAPLVASGEVPGEMNAGLLHGTGFFGYGNADSATSKKLLNASLQSQFAWLGVFCARRSSSTALVTPCVGPPPCGAQRTSSCACRQYRFCPGGGPGYSGGEGLPSTPPGWRAKSPACKACCLRRQRRRPPN